MSSLNQLILDITQLPPARRDREQVSVMKRKWAKERKEKDVPTNMMLFKTYQALVAEAKISKDVEIEGLLRKRSVRSESGIVPIQVLTKPFWCPGKCIFCPNDATMPKSYINTQPGAMRALLNQFDPYKQVYNRLLSLTLTGHATDKIEMIVLGGTRDVYPKKYKKDFVKGLYDACNNFPQFLEKVQVNFDWAQKSARYTQTEGMDMVYPAKLAESLLINETASCRIIGLTIETRPEYVTDENCQLRRELGVTRVEMWIQTLHNDVHEANVRGHDNEAIRLAMHKLRQYAFKVSNHYMPGLYMSTTEKDIETFRIAYSTPWIKSDEQKFYPTAVIPNTPLYDLFQSGEYIPITDADLKQIIRIVKTEIIPPYTRIKRLARDFDTNEVVAGANTPNLRQLLMAQIDKEYAADATLRTKQYARLVGEQHPVSSTEELVDRLTTPLGIQSHEHISLSNEKREIDDRIETYTVDGTFDFETSREFVCLCTRCREVRHTTKEQKHVSRPFVVTRRYRSSVGEELFISFEDALGYLYGFTRLLLPDAGKTVSWDGLGKWTALIREVHVYGTLAWLQNPEEAKGDEKGAIRSKARTSDVSTPELLATEKVQHTWIGTQLMNLAYEIAGVRGYKRLSVISGIGVRNRYRKLGYELDGTYMVKKL